MLSREESLNEVGPKLESIDMINAVSEAAGLAPFELTDFTGKEYLRDYIMDDGEERFTYKGSEDRIKSGKEYSLSRQSRWAHSILTTLPKVTGNSRMHMRPLLFALLSVWPD